MALTSPRGEKALSYMPPYYESSRVVQDLFQAEGEELDDWRDTLNQTLDQTFVRTASWALDEWEEELGLSPAPAQPDSERQSRIVSKLRGTGTATIRVVKEVAESYDNGAIEVSENYPAYTITIHFVDTTGIPPNVEDLKAAVRDVVPAHLSLEFVYNYLTFDELENLNLTFDQLATLNLSFDQLMQYT